jgi:plasmid stability protein
MSKMIQLRNVPDALHRKLKARAAEEGMTLSEYLIRMAQRDLDRPTLAQFRARWETRPMRELSPSPTEILREERDRR